MLIRILFVLLAFSSLALAQEGNSEHLLSKKASCTFELTIEQLTSDDLNFKCSEIFNNKSFRVQNFRIKFMRFASIQVKGNSLNFKSKKIAENLKIGDYVTIFRIENISIGKELNQRIKTLTIKIIE